METRVYVTRVRRTLTEQLKDKIVIDYNNGMRQVDIAAKYGFSQAAISKVISERRVTAHEN